MFWDSPVEWREAQASLAFQIARHSDRGGSDQGGDMKALAAAIAGKIKGLDGVLDRLCGQTCPECDDPCCKRAVVRYDLKDLLFLHLVQNGLPLGQPAPRTGETCSFLGNKGCMVDRLMRPFMCTWYLCPGQMAVVRREKSWREYGLPERLREIQNDRKELEGLFLKLVAPNNTFFESCP